MAGGIYTASGLQGSTGVNDVTAAADITVGVSGGKLIIRADRHANVTVTRADGVSFTLAVRPGINSFELARGFYIVNRTKSDTLIQAILTKARFAPEARRAFFVRSEKME